jgi:hypothetical protein
MTTHSEKPDWLSIAEKASKEQDPEKLMALVGQLCSALESRRKLVAREIDPSTRNSQK